MGVKECSRRWCENIMCDRHSEEYGYLCNECFTELVDRVGTISIEDFMRADKVKVVRFRAFEFYNKKFPVKVMGD